MKIRAFLYDFCSVAVFFNAIWICHYITSKYSVELTEGQSLILCVWIAYIYLTYLIRVCQKHDLAKKDNESKKFSKSSLFYVISYLILAIAGIGFLLDSLSFENVWFWLFIVMVNIIIVFETVKSSIKQFRKQVNHSL